MATSVLTPDKDAVLAEIFIAAPPERVFQALSDPQQTALWWGQSGLYRVTESRGDPRPGGKFYSAGEGHDGTKFHVEGEYLEIDPPRRLVHTWTTSYSGALKTIVRWELEPESIHGLQHRGPQKMGTGTRVKLRHEGFAGNLEQATSHGEGWKRVFGWLQAYVERGETIDTRPAV
jgi:uncharacterized protein YndB with AHSA1/START domain